MGTELWRRENNQWLPDFTPTIDLIKMAASQKTARENEDKEYYGIPMLKRPSWRWEIALYFYLEGISAGSYVIGSLADMISKRNLRPLPGAGHYLAFAALLPCPPLLIADLGRPERFHHMLRIFKPASPMNLGAWALTAYSLPATALAISQGLEDGLLFAGHAKTARKLLPSRAVSGAGLPFALALISYPGVLLSTTSTPIWAKSRFLGALFACSSLSSGASALSLALTLSGKGNRRSFRLLHQVESLSALCEGLALGAFLVTAGQTAKPLLTGGYKWHFWLGAVGAGLVLPELIRRPSRKRQKKSWMANLISSGLSLAGGLALKWALVYAGRESAMDADVSRAVTQPNQSATGWKQTAG